MDPFNDEEQIERRFISHQFPEMDSPAGKYDLAEPVLQDPGSDDD